MIIVDQLGTFDVENAGDLLYPLLLARLLEGRRVRVRRWSPSGGRPAPLRPARGGAGAGARGARRADGRGRGVRR